LDREEDLVQVEDLGEVVSNFSDLLFFKEWNYLLWINYI
jgi:hypothetical protein